MDAFSHHFGKIAGDQIGVVAIVSRFGKTAGKDHQMLLFQILEPSGQLGNAADGAGVQSAAEISSSFQN